MKRLIWKLRYALRINRYSKTGIKYGWYCAEVALEGNEADVSEDPNEWADEEMSNWSD